MDNASKTIPRVPIKYTKIILLLSCIINEKDDFRLAKLKYIGRLKIYLLRFSLFQGFYLLAGRMLFFFTVKIKAIAIIR